MSQYQPPQSPQGVPGQHGTPDDASAAYGQGDQAPAQYGQAPAQYGQASQAPPQYGQASQATTQPGQAGPSDPYGQAGAYAQQGQYGQQPGQPAQQPGQYGQLPGQSGQPGFGGQYGGSPYPTAPGGPGLFDTQFAQPSTLRTAKIAYVAIIVLAAVLALGGLLGAIRNFVLVTTAFGGGSVSLLDGLIQLISGPALGFVVLTVGRLFVDYFVQQAKALENKD